MTLSAWGMVFAAALVIAGVLSFGRKLRGRPRMLGIIGSVVLGVSVGWLSWLAVLPTQVVDGSPAHRRLAVE